MGKLKTNEQFVNEFHESQKTDKNINIIGKYINNKHGIECLCKKCGYTWSPRPTSILSGAGCPKCKGNLKKTTNEFAEEMRSVSDCIDVIGEYTGSHNKIKCYCKICNSDFWSSPTHLLNGKGCPSCKGYKISKSLKLTKEEAQDKLSEAFNNLDIISEYKNAKSDIIVRCRICGKEYHTNLSSAIVGGGCKNCNHTISKGEKFISAYLSKNNIEYELHKTYRGLNGVGNRPLSYDFYLPKNNLLIEFQGEQHYKPIPIFREGYFKTQLEHDRRKREYAKNNGIELLEIEYTQINNIDKLIERKISNNIPVTTTAS